MTENAKVSNVEEELRCLAELLGLVLKSGRHWLKSMKPDDWRSKRYGPPVRRHSRNDGLTDGKPPIRILQHDEVGVIHNTITHGNGGRECNIIVKPDPPSEKHGQGFVALLKVVPHENFDQIKHINFNIWFHGVANASYEDQIIGWRFEGSEGNSTSHNLYHAQPIKSFKRNEPFKGFVEWVPETFPTFPIAAKNQLQLAFVVLLTLGGKESLRKVILEATNPKLRDEARTYWGSIFAGEKLSS